MTDSQGKYGDLLKRAKAKPAEAKPVESAKAKTKAADKIVTFTMNCPKSHRQWWAGQAKLQGLTMTEVATEALIEAFGLPPDT